MNERYEKAKLALALLKSSDIGDRFVDLFDQLFGYIDDLKLLADTYKDLWLLITESKLNDVKNKGKVSDEIFKLAKRVEEIELGK